MLVDRLRDFIKERPNHVSWIGFDAKKNGPEAQAGEKLRQLFDDVILFDIVPLQPTLQETFGEKPFRFTRDCFSPIPPYPKSGFEFYAGGQRSLTLLEMIKIGDVVPYVDSYVLKEEALKRPGQASPLVKVAHDPADRVPLVEAAYFITASMLMHLTDGDKDRDTIVFFDSYAGYYVSRHGELLTSPIANPDMKNAIDDPVVVSLLEIAMQYFNYTAMAANLMACKNVTHVASPIDKRAQRLRSRKNKPPLSEYRRIVIEAPPTLRRNLSASPNHTEIKRRQHDVPAGIRDYTERGLFGKWKGRFFFSAHKRGDASLGTIKKQYTVVDPREREEQTNGS